MQMLYSCELIRGVICGGIRGETGGMSELGRGESGALRCCENVEQDRRLSSGLRSGDGETMWWARILGLERRLL